MARKPKKERLIVCDGVKFVAPPGRAKTNLRKWLNSLLTAGIGVWGVTGAWARHPYVAVAIGVFYIEVFLVRIPALLRSGGVVFRADLARRVAAPLRELTEIAHCALPRVALRDDATQVVGVTPVRRAVLLILSTQWADELSDRELRALLAHELAHVVHCDFFGAKIRREVTLFLGIGGSLTFTIGLTGTITWSTIVATMPIFMVAAAIPLSALNRRRERRADSTGAQLSGDPHGLAMALMKTQSFRDATNSQLYGAKRWRWLLFPLALRMPSHPATSKRVLMLTKTVQDQLAVLPSSAL